MICRLSKVSDSIDIFTLMNSNLDDFFSLDAIEFFLMQWPSGQLVVEDAFGKKIGAICGSRLENGNASISLFAVDSHYRKQGVGKQLLESFRTRCYMEGISTIQLELRTTNTEALRFYKNNGFVITETMKSFYSDGGDAYRMKNNLEGILNASS